MVRILFCADPLNARLPDESYRGEFEAATGLGLDVDLIRIERLVDDHDAVGAVRSVRAADAEVTAFYRGWMLRPHQYSALYSALLSKGVRLINTPEQYRHCHYLPEWYPTLERHTPRTTWIHMSELAEPRRLSTALDSFGNAPLILKDYVKSRKHEWTEACFIPSAQDRDAVQRVMRRFVELQGESLTEGLVFREFISLRRVGEHPKSGMPLTQEYRLFFIDGECVQVSEYWDCDYRASESVPIDRFSTLAAGVASRFFTMDVALRDDREWIIVELGDAQVAQLPERSDATTFYRKLTASR